MERLRFRCLDQKILMNKNKEIDYVSPSNKEKGNFPKHGQQL